MTAEQGTHQAQREHVAALHAYLTRYELVTWTSGNVSAFDPDSRTFVMTSFTSMSWKMRLSRVLPSSGSIRNSLVDC